MTLQVTSSESFDQKLSETKYRTNDLSGDVIEKMKHDLHCVANYCAVRTELRISCFYKQWKHKNSVKFVLYFLADRKRTE